MLQLRPRTIVFFLGLFCIVHGCLSLFHILESRREELEQDVKDAQFQLNKKLAGGHFSRQEQPGFDQDLKGKESSTAEEGAAQRKANAPKTKDVGIDSGVAEFRGEVSSSDSGEVQDDSPASGWWGKVRETFSAVRYTIYVFALLVLLILYRLLFGAGKSKKLAGIFSVLIMICLAYVVFVGLTRHLPDGAEKLYRSGTEKGSKMFRAFFMITVGSSISLLSVLWNIQTASRNWLQSVGFAGKGVGALIVVLLGYYFQVDSDINKHRDSLTKYEQQTAALDRKRKEDRLEFLRSIAVSLGATDSPSTKGALLASLSPMIQDPDRMSIAALQMVHQLAVHDEDQKIKDLARKYLFPNLDTGAYPVDIPLFGDALVEAFENDEKKELSIYTPPYLHYYEFFLTESRHYRIAAKLEGAEGTVRIPEDTMKAWRKPGEGNKEVPKELASVAIVAASSDKKFGSGDNTSEVATAALEKSFLSKATLEEAVRALPRRVQRELRPRLLFFVPGTEEDYPGWSKAQSRIQEAIKKGLSPDDDLEKFIIMPPMLISPTGAVPPLRNQVRYYLHRDDREADEKIRGRGILIEEKLEAVSTKEERTEVEFQRYGGDPSETDLEFEGIFSQFEVWFSTKEEVLRFVEFLGVEFEEPAAKNDDSGSSEVNVGEIPKAKLGLPAPINFSPTIGEGGKNKAGGGESAEKAPAVPLAPEVLPIGADP